MSTVAREDDFVELQRTNERLEARVVELEAQLAAMEDVVNRTLPSDGSSGGIVAPSTWVKQVVGELWLSQRKQLVEAHEREIRRATTVKPDAQQPQDTDPVLAGAPKSESTSSSTCAGDDTPVQPTTMMLPESDLELKAAVHDLIHWRHTIDARLQRQQTSLEMKEEEGSQQQPVPHQRVPIFMPSGRSAPQVAMPAMTLEKVVAHRRFKGVYILSTPLKDELVTRNLAPGVSVYGEKLRQVTVAAEGTEEKLEFRTWNPYRSKLASAIYGGVENIYMGPGSAVLYLGGASGTTVSHVSDLVGPEGVVYAVEFSPRSGRDLEEMSKRRPNIVPIVEDARHPLKYRMLIPRLVDCIFIDVAQPDQGRILGLNALHFLKPGGGFVISIKANCIDSTADASTVFASEVAQLREKGFKPKEQVTLEPFENGTAVLIGVYLPKTA